jgi:hypothetical protein
MRKLGLITILLAFGCGGGSGGDDDAIDAAGPDADPSAPTCTISGPTDGSETGFDIAVDLTATATDLEDGTLSGASVVWRTDLDTAPLGIGLALSTTLPVGENAVTCTATDSDGNTGSDTVTITSRSPYALINHPSDNETRSVADGDFPFAGVGLDLEDGSLTGAALVWTSNLDGQLGTGEAFDALPSQGVHTITLTATDGDANTHSMSITLTMNP